MSLPDLDYHGEEFAMRLFYGRAPIEHLLEVYVRRFGVPDSYTETTREEVIRALVTNTSIEILRKEQGDGEGAVGSGDS